MTDQVAGKTCIVCDEMILVAAQAAGCPACGVVFHLDCTEGTRCPGCGADFRRVQAENEASDRFREKSRIQSGKTLMWVALGVVILLNAALLALMVQTGAEKIFQTIVRVLVFGVFWLWAYLGANWARVTLGVFGCLGIAASLFFLTQVFLVGVIGLGYSGFMTWVFLGSQPVRSFVGRSRKG